MPFTEMQAQFWPKVQGMLRRNLEHHYKSEIHSSGDRSLLHRAFNIAQEILSRELEEDDSLWRSAYKYFIDALVRQDLGTRKIFNALPDFLSITPIESSFRSITNEILVALGERAPSTPPPHFDKTELNAIISTEVAEEYGPVDERVFTCDERKQRRMDSLTRLLTLQGCACIAATIHNGQLMVALNVEKNSEQDEHLRIITLKIRSLQKHVHDYIETPNLVELNGRAEQLYLTLLKLQTSRSDKPDVARQAARKILHAIVFDEYTFDPKEKAALLNPKFTLLTPQQDDHNITYLRTHTEDHDSLTLLPQVKRGSSIRTIHAEQLLATSIYTLGKSSTPSVFGISKLCCHTCFDSLMTHCDSAAAPLISVRGTHQQSYQGVIHLPTGVATPHDSKGRAITHAKPSPEDTPDRPPLRPRPIGIFAPAATVCRRLFVEEDEEDIENRTGGGASAGAGAGAGAGEASAKGSYDLMDMPLFWSKPPHNPSFLPHHAPAPLGEATRSFQEFGFGPASRK